jgi:hypothetical protein
LHDGNKLKKIPFINHSRPDIWGLTPYDKTLLIDSDFLIFSNTLSNYWDVDEDILISSEMADIRGGRKGVLDQWVSDEGISLLWATTVMFTKTEKSKLFFNLVSHIRDNYELYSEIYRFDNRTYRNDISFSIAKHILDGFVKDGTFLPPILTCQDRDLIYSVHENGLRLIIADAVSQESYIICKLMGRDVHIMNKQAIVRSASEILKTI